MSQVTNWEQNKISNPTPKNSTFNRYDTASVFIYWNLERSINCSEMPSNIEIIREWIEKETVFIGRTDELFISMYLEACDHDVEKTKRRIVRYYELRRLYPRLMTGRDCLDEKHLKLFHQKVMYSDVVMENYELPVVLTIKLSRLESDDNVSDGLRALIFTIETGLLDSARFRKYGGMAIFDLENIKFSHAMQVTPNLIMQTLKCIMEGLPIKGRGILFINFGSIVRTAITVGSLFLPSEIRNLITMSSGSWESIRDKVPSQCLPIEYGGTNGTLDENMRNIEAIFRKWRDYLLDDEQYGFKEIEEES